ncbi:type IV conjugative transfer system protein TraE [Geoalkalibacter halelectricus]|uniref:type IV conjugative transfer system protein TraE n=1 Tax=Geoalkalibacter halelectricus TaxID=2847045 RepID=UPI003D1A98D1
MKFNIFASKASNLFAENKILKLTLVGLFMSQIFLGFFVYGAVQYKTTVLIPYGVAEYVEITRGIPDENYTRMRIRDTVSLALTYSPATARRQFNELLAFYAPEEFPAASAFWFNHAKRIEEVKSSSVFEVQNMKPDTKNGLFEVTGRRLQYIDDQKVEEQRRTYLVRYQYRYGRYTLISIEEKVR